MAIALPAASDAGAAAASEPLWLSDGTAASLQGDADARGAAMAAEIGGRIAGRVIYTRVYGPRAVLSLDVDQAFMHRGLPELLLRTVCRYAARDGITTFLMRLPANEIWLLARLREDFGARWRREGASVDVELPVPEPPATAA
jgi:GNAT superfamily N-acetyltransferase